MNPSKIVSLPCLEPYKAVIPHSEWSPAPLWHRRGPWLSLLPCSLCSLCSSRRPAAAPTRAEHISQLSLTVSSTSNVLPPQGRFGHDLCTPPRAGHCPTITHQKGLRDPSTITLTHHLLLPTTYFIFFIAFITLILHYLLVCINVYYFFSPLRHKT